MKHLCARTTLVILFSLTFLFNATATIKIIQVGAGGSMFSPSNFSVCMGDTIDFVWVSGFHNVHITSPATTPSPDLQQPGDKFRYIPSAALAYVFQCDYHAPGMSGTFSVNALPVVNLGGNVTQCGGNVLLDAGNPGATYLWTPAATTQTVSATTSGTYSVLVTDANGCSASDKAKIQIEILAVVNLGSNVTQCGGFVVLDAGNPGSTFVWSPSGNTQIITALTTGTYSVSVTNSCGTVSDAIDITINTKPVVNLGPDQTQCGGSIVLDAMHPGDSYVWSPSGTTQMITALATGTYSVVVTDANSCTGSDAVMITINAPPVVNLGADVTQCGGSVILNAGNPGSTYAWSPAGTTQMITALTTGTYSVLVTDAKTCTGSDKIDVTINSVPVVNLGPDQTQCGGSVQLDAGNPGLTYAWSTNESTQIISALSSGSYTVVVTDANTCTGTDQVNITISSLPVVNLGPDITQCGGSVKLDAMNPGSGYLWSTGATSQIITALTTGTYSVDVTNSCGTVSDLIMITFNSNPVVNLGADVTQCGGSVLLDAMNPGSTYLWSTTETTQIISALATGTYSVIVTTANGCASSDTINITIGTTSPVVNLGPDQNVCSGPVILDAGNPGLTYAWSPAGTTQIISALVSGTYSVVVTSANSCTGTDTINIIIATTQNPPLVEGFENPGFPPAGWTLNNPDNGITWDRTTTAFSSGSASMYVDNFNYMANGEIDELTLPSLNLSGPSSMLTFQVAYQMYSDPTQSPNFSDTLRVEVSTDCGASWTTAYVNYGSALATVIPDFSTNQFVPASSSDWRMETVALPTAPNVTIKFKHTTDYENDMYVDDINISSVVGAQETDIDSRVTVFPNPSSGNVFVKVNALDMGNVALRVYNVLGELVYTAAEVVIYSTTFKLDLSAQQDGIYFVEVASARAKTVQKLVLNK